MSIFDAIRRAAQAAAQGREPYKPKFCRTRGCTKPYMHEDGHNGKHRNVMHIAGQRGGVNRKGINLSRWQPRRSSAAPLRDPVAAVRMAQYRARPIKHTS